MTEPADLLDGGFDGFATWLLSHLELPRHTTTPDATFEELGFDSIDRMETLVAVQDAGVVVPEAIADALSGPGELFEYICLQVAR
ncbi:MAG: acyl carrier protein [Acidimicrobiales bacterium]